MSIESEIESQPAVLAGILERGGPSIRAAAAALRSADIESLTVAARGTSDHAAVYAQYLFGVRNRLAVGLASPSLFSVYRAAPRLSHGAVIAISQSGASPDVVAVVEAARDQGRPTIAITNEPASPLAAAAEFVVDIGAGREGSIAATKTYTAELMALAMLSVAIDGRDPAGHRSLRLVPGTVAAALEATAVAERVAAETSADLATCDRALVLGRGLEYATVREWSLKLKELAQVSAEPYSAADFAHGPIALAGAETIALVVAATGPTLPGLRTLIERLRTLGARLVVLSDDPSTLRLEPRALAIPSGLPEWLRPIASIVPAQLFCVALARRRGLDPERPANLAKVTLTR